MKPAQPSRPGRRARPGHPNPVPDAAGTAGVAGGDPVPGPVRAAGLLLGAQGVTAAGAAATLVVRGLAGADERMVNGFGTAGWFALAAAAVLAGSWALLHGRRWGRGIAVFTNLMLLPVAWYAGVGSHRAGYGIAVAAVAVTVLALLFSPPAVRWAAGPGRPS